MRPVILKIKGLRSYRDEQVIDFTNKDLVGIIGDTGAGKSSLLEAICFALYGNCTWRADSAKPLIADGGDGTLRVELTFRARSGTWIVTRTMSRNYYPPSIHRLVSLDDDTDISGADRVNETVRRLVGLDYSTFLKAVVLPQGRFQELLITPEAGRTSVLKNILGLDDITAVREHALTLHARLRPLLTNLEVQRATLLPDPAAVIEQATTDLEAANEQLAKLDTAKNAIDTAKSDGRKYATRATECRKLSERLAEKAPADVDAQYRVLVELDESFAAEFRELAHRLGGHEQQENDLTRTLAEADSEGSGVAAVRSAVNTLTTLGDQLPQLEEQQRILDDERVALVNEREALLALTATVRRLADAAETARATALGAGTAASATAEKLATARGLLATARAAVAAATAATQAAHDAQERASQRERSAAAAAKEADRAEDDLAIATQILEALYRAHSAAHAASASHPGDPCPVCSQELPTDFVPQTVEGVEDATSTHATAKKLAKRLADKSASAGAEARTTIEEAINAQQTAIDRCGASGRAINSVREIVGQVDLSCDDNAILVDLVNAAEESDRAYKKASERAEHARDKATGAAAELKPATVAADTRAKTLSMAQQTLERHMRKLIERTKDVPERYWVEGELTIEGINLQKAAAQEREAELAEIAQRLEGTRKEMDKLRGRERDLQQRRNASVDKPAARLHGQIQSLADRSQEAADLFGEQQPPQPTSNSLTDEASWAAAVLAAATELIKIARLEMDNQEHLAAKARDAAREALAACSVTTEDELQRALIKLSTDAHLAQRDIETARRQQPLAAELDQRITAARPVVASLDELGRLLTDGRFISAVVRRRQRALLGTATSRLRSMTEGRFAFAEDFQIIDGHTGQPRDVKTLSGGETFQASLALALAVVELTSRAGGRVEALFLDEGFGTLDTNALTYALETLSAQASGGRLVAIISHMRAIADNLDHVLIIDKTFGGSQAHWASTIERNQLLTEEVSAGLLA